MKRKRTFRYCECCDKAWEDISPLPKEAYQSGLIEIEGGEHGFGAMTVLRARRKRGSCYSFSVGGIFCNLDCLVKYIKEKM